MKNLVETYISQSPGSLAQVESARKAFKAELKNGPVKPVSYANGIQGQKAFGNFDLQLFHQAYDADLDAQGLLVHFDDHGLVNRNSYQAFKAATGECAKYTKELWVLQYGKSDYKLTNVPASSIPLTPEGILQKLIKDDTLLNIFRYTVDNITFTNGEYKICHDVFTDWLGTPEKLQQFLTAT